MGTPLDEVLGGAASAPAAESQPQETQQAVEQPGANETATGEPQTQTQPAEGAGAGAESGSATPAQEPGTMVPLKALEEERKGRQDWKEKAIRAEAALDALRAQASQGSGQQQAAPQQPQQLSYEQALLNERMNMSEMMVRQQHGDESVDGMLATFQAAVAKNPALAAELAQQRHPWQWMYDQAARMKALDEIGNDPAAYRARIRAELEAELKAAPAANSEQSTAAAPAAAAPTLPKSLATARSAAPRTAQAWSGPTSLNDILKR